MQWSWFGPIANNGECAFQLLSCALTLLLLLMTILSSPVANDFHISVTQVNWLGNIMSCIYVPASIFIPVICSRYGIRRCVRLSYIHSSSIPTTIHPYRPMWVGPCYSSLHGCATQARSTRYLHRTRMPSSSLARFAVSPRCLHMS